MTIHTKPIYKLLTLVGLTSVLAACGSGGGSSGPAADTTPDSFTFAAVTDAAVSTDVSSATLSVAGINQSATISITGGTYSIAGGAFTSTTGTVSNGQSVVVKVTSSAATNTAVEAVLNIGGVAGNFKVTTKPDVTPDAFTFTAAIGVKPKDVSTSSAITVAGIDVAVPISVTGGEYSINDGAFTSTAGTISKAQTVKVRGTASADLATNTNVELTVGGVKGNYSITTFADTVAPTAQILFPPPVSMTEGNTILVRGTASDDYSNVTSVKVNGIDVTPKAAGDFSTWQVSVPLTASIDNNLIVATEDSAGNKSSTQSQPAAKIMVRQGNHKNAFPDDSVDFNSVEGLVIDKLDGRNRLLVSNSSGEDGELIATVDLTTGKRSIFASSVSSVALVIEPSTKRVYGVDSGKLFYLDLADASFHEAASFVSSPYVFSLTVDTNSLVPKIVGIETISNLLLAHEISSANYTIISDAATALPDTANPFFSAFGLAFDKKNSRYLVANGGQTKDLNKHAILSVDRVTGARTILSSNTVGAGDPFTGLVPEQGNNYSALSAIVVDDKNNRAIVAEGFLGRFFFVDLATGNRKLFSDSSQIGAINPFDDVVSIALDDSGNYIFVSDITQNGIYAVDLVTGERVIFSKSASTK